jgi:hypothetical protein
MIFDDSFINRVTATPEEDAYVADSIYDWPAADANPGSQFTPYPAVTIFDMLNGTADFAELHTARDTTV